MKEVKVIVDRKEMVFMIANKRPGNPVNGDFYFQQIDNSEKHCRQIFLLSLSLLFVFTI